MGEAPAAFLEGDFDGLLDVVTILERKPRRRCPTTAAS